MRAALADDGFLAFLIIHGNVHWQGAEKVCDIEFFVAMLLGRRQECEGFVAEVVF